MLTRLHPRLTERAREVLTKADAIAAERGEPGASSMHVLLSMLDGGQNVASYVLIRHGIDEDALSHALRMELPNASDESSATMNATVWIAADDQLTERAKIEADALDSPYIGVEHLLLALLHDAHDPAAHVLRRIGVDYAEAREGVVKVLQPG